MSDCIFCDINDLTTKLTENKRAYARLDGFPVSPGHVLIIPKRHVETCFDLTTEEVLDMFLLMLDVKLIIDKLYKPDGYNVGFNVNEAGGQTVMHCHMHLIPRYNGDVDNPRGGIRGVIPKNKDY